MGAAADDEPETGFAARTTAPRPAAEAGRGPQLGFDGVEVSHRVVHHRLVVDRDAEDQGQHRADRLAGLRHFGRRQRDEEIVEPGTVHSNRRH
jgi:hypothetical protein